jgi:hypothetical protein
MGGGSTGCQDYARVMRLRVKLIAVLLVPRSDGESG